MKKATFLLGLCVSGFSFADDSPLTTMTTSTNETKPQVIDCNYKLEKDTSIDQSLLTTWASRAAKQSFSFTPENLNNEMEGLKKCFTGPGWKAFNDALNASGNLTAIRQSGLTVTSEIAGTTKVNTVKEDQWKVTVPLKVTYQNKDKELVQNLDVDLLIRADKPGSFGIMQVIAVPKQ